MLKYVLLPLLMTPGLTFAFVALWHLILDGFALANVNETLAHPPPLLAFVIAVEIAVPAVRILFLQEECSVPLFLAHLINETAYQFLAPA